MNTSLTRMLRVRVGNPVRTLVLKDAVQKLHRRGIAVMTSGIRPGQRQVLDSVGALELLRLKGREYATTPEARTCLKGAGVMPAPPAHAARTSAQEHVR